MGDACDSLGCGQNGMNLVLMPDGISSKKSAYRKVKARAWSFRFFREIAGFCPCPGCTTLLRYASTY